MDQETTQYILTHYLHLTDPPLKQLFIYTQQLYKYRHTRESNYSLTLHYRQLGWITEKEDVLSLLKDGFDKFEMEVAVRIFNQHKDQIRFNHCPECNALARTPEAQQCRRCGCSWRRDQDKYQNPS
ncbi:hypothetical protein SAMN04488128_1011859 [Chitinophaga eiseniae]|uniref:Uncharacterized protein n=1 Tax=Chitinophaga eiseniae TaxID=634771 RepID=A0A1T4P1K0_9BACT|nr:hypothetical protein [Chitinophaga eiseniae]SJZ85319.1 hypothetical protein SAMN04488128_1011859 [Chitinophaga eiseniae]